MQILNKKQDQTAPVIHCCSLALGAAPTWREAISPPLKIIRVGIDITPYFDAVFGLSSTLSFTILTLSPIAPEISSSAGAIMRHGPHHSAQKSTTTGPRAFSTSASKSASETLPTAMRNLVRLEKRARLSLAGERVARSSLSRNDGAKHQALENSCSTYSQLTR